jgi:hypothetical protein
MRARDLIRQPGRQRRHDETREGDCARGRGLDSRCRRARHRLRRKLEAELGRQGGRDAETQHVDQRRPVHRPGGRLRVPRLGDRGRHLHDARQLPRQGGEGGHDPHPGSGEGDADRVGGRQDLHIRDPFGLQVQHRRGGDRSDLRGRDQPQPESEARVAVRRVPEGRGRRRGGRQQEGDDCLRRQRQRGHPEHPPDERRARFHRPAGDELLLCGPVEHTGAAGRRQRPERRPLLHRLAYAEPDDRDQAEPELRGLTAEPRRPDDRHGRHQHQPEPAPGRGRPGRLRHLRSSADGRGTPLEAVRGEQGSLLRPRVQRGQLPRDQHPAGPGRDDPESDQLRDRPAGNHPPSRTVRRSRHGSDPPADAPGVPGGKPLPAQGTRRSAGKVVDARPAPEDDLYLSNDPIAQGQAQWSSRT